jgi:hypothetical protein
MDSDGLHWYEVDADWKSWSPQGYIEGLKHSRAERGFQRDMAALAEAEVCVYVMPCGVSASLEAGWACGAGKLVFVYIPELREPELMVKMARLVTDDFEEIREAIRRESAVLLPRFYRQEAK